MGICQSYHSMRAASRRDAERRRRVPRPFKFQRGDMLRITDRNSPFYQWEVVVQSVDEVPPTEAMLKMEITAPTFFYRVRPSIVETQTALYFHHNQLDRME